MVNKLGKTLSIIMFLVAATPLTLAFQAADAEAGSQTQLMLESCKIPGYPETALCGTLEVYENRATQKGRKIPIKVVVIPAKSETPKPDPVFVLLGGPGQGAASLAGFIFPRFQGVHSERDIVFVDIRGTGASNPLNCAFFGPEDSLQTYVTDMFDPEYVRVCREKLDKKGDLSLYTTTYAMADLNDVRAALGYEKINLSGGSYGTRASLEFMRQFPQHVRSAVLLGLAPITVPMPRHFARDAQASLDAVLADCAADPACHGAFPNLDQDTAQALAAFEKGSITQTVTNPNTKKDETVTMPRGAFVTALRAMLYSSFRARDVPLYLHEAANGNFEPFIQFSAGYNKGLIAGLSDGLYLSMTCAEDLPFVDLAAARKEAQGTFLGTYRIDQQWEACQQWKQGEVEEAFRQTLKSDIPVLLISGEHDPVTPPYMGDMVAQGLPNALHLVVPHAAHGAGIAGACLVPIINTFVEQGHGNNIDTGCISSVKRPDFTLPKKNQEEKGK